MTWSRQPLSGPARPEIERAVVYDETTGYFFRRNDGSRADAPAPYGYRRIYLYGKRYLAHRVAWLLTHGEWPSLTIDHINGNPADNSKVNLRIATRLQQQGNRRVQACASGRKGVHQAPSGRYIAHICRDRKSRYIGSFATADEAAAAYTEAAKKHFGNFAKGN
jgi:hypothetical protein